MAIMLGNLTVDEIKARVDVLLLTRELDVLLNGEEGAARQASLCDIVAQVRMLVTPCDGLGGWINSEISQPPLIEGQDYSNNVWGYDANDQRILVVSFFIDSDGWHWANAYGDVWGDAEFDDDYDIQYWQPIAIPTPPNAELTRRSMAIDDKLAANGRVE